MKIIQILPELNAGGVEHGTLEVAAHLVRQGHESIVISNGGRLVEALESAGSRHISMPVHRKSLASLFQVRPLRNLLEQEKPDILHIRSRVPGWISWLAWRGMDSATRPKLVSTVHGFYSVNAYSEIMARGERVIAVSESIRRYILENYPKCQEEKIEVISFGIDPELYRPDFRPSDEWIAKWKAKYPGLTGKHMLLLPGRITRMKGHEDFFQIVANLKRNGIPAHGLVAGDTHVKKHSYYMELRGLLSKLGIQEDITFLGQRDDLREIMAFSEIVFSLSQQPEAFGRTVLEALSLGKPVIGYNCGGVGELLTKLFPKGCVPAGEVSSAVQLTRELLEEEPEIKPIGEFSLSQMLDKTLQFYQNFSSSFPLNSSNS